MRRTIWICRICGEEALQVASATPELAMFQHLLWIHGIRGSEEARSDGDA